MKYIVFATSLLAMVITLVSDSCRFPQNHCFKEYAFEINFTCTPQKGTFRIGDTIWIESSIPPALVNQLDNLLVNTNDVEYKIYGGINRYDELFTSPPEYNFSYFNNTGEVRIQNIGPYATLELDYEKTVDNTYTLKLGCIPQSIGLYEIAFYTLTEDYHSIDGVIDKACIETINITYIMNNNEDDNNYHLLETRPSVTSIDGFRQAGGYAFWVVE